MNIGDKTGLAFILLAMLVFCFSVISVFEYTKWRRTLVMERNLERVVKMIDMVQAHLEDDNIHHHAIDRVQGRLNELESKQEQ